MLRRGLGDRYHNYGSRHLRVERSRIEAPSGDSLHGSKGLRVVRSTTERPSGRSVRIEMPSGGPVHGSKRLRAIRSTAGRPSGRSVRIEMPSGGPVHGSKGLRVVRSTIETPSGGLIGETSGARTRVQALGVSLFLGAICYWMACPGHRRQKGKWPGAKLVQHQRPHRAMTSGLDYPHPARSVPREAVGFVSTKYCVLLY